MSALRVIAPGMLTTVQDLGRWGFQSSGVSVAGPMDAYAHRLANALVGNAAEGATLEVTLTGPELECDDERVIAVSGAAFEITADERPVPLDTAVELRPRSRLKFGRRLAGARAYLGVAGGIDVPRVLGSRATHLSSAIGGVEGRALRTGDILPLGPACRDGRRGPAEQPPPLFRRSANASGTGLDAGLPNGHARVRVLPGPHLESFAAGALTMLQSSAYRIDPRSDRMGFRLEGARLARTGDTEMISDAIAMGALQVPASGHPILLMADRQTTGGYPIIATVIAADLGLAGQLAPGDSIAFVVCSRAEAMAALIAREQRILAATHAEWP